MANGAPAAALGVVLRKCRSALLLASRALGNRARRLRLGLLGYDIRFGEGATLGRQVDLRTTDGGTIRIGPGVRIDDYAVLYAQRGSINLGANGYVGVGTHIVAGASIDIGRDALIAAYCVIRDSNHGMEPGMPMARQPQRSQPVRIGEDVWLGAHVAVTAGTSIGSGAVVGANAVVTRDLPPFCIAAGVPARVLRQRTAAPGAGRPVFAAGAAQPLQPVTGGV